MKIWLYLLCAIPETSLTASKGQTRRPPVGRKTVKATSSLLRSSPTIVPLYITSNISTLSASVSESRVSLRAQELTDNASLTLLIVTVAMVLILSAQLLLINLLRCKLRRRYNQCVEEIKKLVKQMYSTNLESSTDKAGALDNIVITATPNAQSTMVTLTLSTGAAVNPPRRSLMKEAIRKFKSLVISLNDKTAGLHDLQDKRDASPEDNLADAMEKRRVSKEKVMPGSKEGLKPEKGQKLVIPLLGADKDGGIDKNVKKDKGDDLLHSTEVKVKPSTPVEPSALKKDDHYFSVRKEKPELVPEQKSQKQKLPPAAPVGPNTPMKDEHYFSVRKEKPETAVSEQKHVKQKLLPPAPVEPNTPKKDEHYFSVRKEKPEVAVPEQKNVKQKLPSPTPLEPNKQKKEEDFFSLPKAKT